MARYFFDVRDGAMTIFDQEGIELKNLAAVREEVTRVARQRMSEHGHELNGRTFVVRDQHGHFVLSFPFKLAISD